MTIKLFKRIISFFVILIAVFSVATTHVFADNVQQSNVVAEENDLNTTSVEGEFSGYIGLSANPVYQFEVTSGDTYTVLLVMGRVSGPDTEFTMCINKDNKYFTSFLTENNRVNKKIYLPKGTYTVQLLSLSNDVYYAYNGMIYN